jgi:hypothetical protein
MRSGDVNTGKVFGAPGEVSVEYWDSNDPNTGRVWCEDLHATWTRRVEVALRVNFQPITNVLSRVNGICPDVTTGQSAIFVDVEYPDMQFLASFIYSFLWSKENASPFDRKSRPLAAPGCYPLDQSDRRLGTTIPACAAFRSRALCRMADR